MTVQTFTRPTASTPAPARHRATGRPLLMPRGPLVALAQVDGTLTLAAYVGGEHRA